MQLSPVSGSGIENRPAPNPCGRGAGQESFAGREASSHSAARARCGPLGSASQLTGGNRRSPNEPADAPAGVSFLLGLCFTPGPWVLPLDFDSAFALPPGYSRDPNVSKCEVEDPPQPTAVQPTPLSGDSVREKQTATHGFSDRAVARFRSRYRVDRATGCWRWLATTTGEGYGLMSADGQSLLAHRLSYLVHVGPLDPSLTVDHLCKNPGCVNPLHLQQVSQAENCRRAASDRKPRPTLYPSKKAPRPPRPARTHCRHGHELARVYVDRKTGAKRCVVCRLAATARWTRKRRALLEAVA